MALCSAITFFCIRYGYTSDLNITLFSLAVIFPLVFTIREAFKRRDNTIQLLSVFKSSLNATYYCLITNPKMDEEKKAFISQELEDLSTLFFNSLYSSKHDATQTRSKLTVIFEFVKTNRKTISHGLAIKIIRLLKDVQESMENTIGISMHGTPVSLRAYCLVYIYFFPFIFVPTLVTELNQYSVYIVYIFAATPGFILISLYNIQERMEDPFDQSGLDDIKVEEFSFELPKPNNSDLTDNKFPVLAE
ncbi:MAG: hypothetical protein ACJAY7_001848 [Pseudohongiellaceae bacterium]|jgi:hypothetical protein